MRSELARTGINALIRSRGLTEPDARALHQYDVHDDELEDLRWYVQTQSAFRWRARDSAALALLISEWGYRNAENASAFVPLALKALELEIPRDQLYQRLDEGLIFWKRRRKKPQVHAWNSTLLLEGSVPRRMPRSGIEQLSAEIGREMSWFVLARTTELPEFSTFVNKRCRVYPDLLENPDDRLFWHDFFLKFAAYQQGLTQHSLLPRSGENFDDWLTRIPALARPASQIPLRTDDHNLFVDALFAELKIFPTSPQRIDSIGSSKGAKTAVHFNPRPLLESRTAVGGARELGVLREVRARGVLGLPLYTYKLSSAEFDDLLNQVRRDVASGHTGRFAAARFCLYASEQLCRSYSGGSWTWDVVMQPIDWSPSPMERAQTVRAGLEYWQRPVLEIGEQQRLLMSLVREGGLPLALLQNERESHLKQFLRRLIQNSERFHQRAEVFVEEQIELLPLALRNKTMQDISADLANSLIALRQKIPPRNILDPIELLNEIQPGWQSEVPLRLDDSFIRDFIGGLLLEPRTELRAEPVPIRVTTTLHLTPPVRVERRASCVKETSVEGLGRLLRLDATVLMQHTRILLSLVTTTGERHQVALARLNDDEKTYQLERLAFRPVRYEASVVAPLLLSATVGEREIASSDIQGGEALLSELPWVFDADEGGVAEFLGQGTVRCRSKQALVLLPSNFESPEQLKTSGDTVLGRAIRLFSGTRTWCIDDERWTISTSTPVMEQPSFVFSGPRARGGFSGSEYWDGLPSIEVVGSANRASAHALETVEARVNGTKLWRPYGELCGKLDVRVRRGHDTIFRTEIVALPKGTKIELRAREQVIAIKSSELRQASFLNGAPAVAVEGECKLRVEESRRETSFEVCLLFSAGRCELTLPSPLRICEFVGREGNVTDFVVLDRLGQIRARAISPNLTDEFWLEARVKGRVSWLPIAHLPRVQSDAGVWELSLDTVRAQFEDFFTSLGALDTELEVQLVDPKSSRRAPTLQVKLYEAEPHTSTIADGVLVELGNGAAARIGRMGLDLLKVQIRPLSSPDAPPSELVRLSDSSWKISNEQLASAHTWLVTGSIRDRVRLRPRVLTNDGYNYTQNATCDLDAAMRDRYTTSRQARLETLVGELSANWLRQEWDELPKLFDTFGTLPSTTFDVLRSAAHEPSMACAALFRCGGDVESVRRIWDGMEQLPFLWALVPASTWLQTATQFDRWCLELSVEDRALAAKHARFYAAPLSLAGKDRSPLLVLIYEFLVESSSLLTSTPNGWFSYPRQALEFLLKDNAQKLLIRHAESRWPVNVVPVRTTADIELGDDSVVQALEGIGSAHRQKVLKIPYLIGLAVGSDQRIAAESQLSVRRLRSFDPAWFDLAHAIGFCVSAGAQLPRNKK